MIETKNFFLQLFEGMDKFDYKVINENWQRIDDALNELLNGGDSVILPTMTIEKTEKGYSVTTHDVKGSQTFELYNGKNAYQYALDGGYTGTEEEFAKELAARMDISISEEINQWLDEHPEATTTVQDGSIEEIKFTNALKLKTVKDYVTPQMYGYKDDTDDVGAYINLALKENDTVFVPDGIYQLKTTIVLFGSNYDMHDGVNHHTKGKSVVFSEHAILNVTENINVFDVSGNGNTISGGLIDLTSMGVDYNKTAIYLHSESANSACIGNKILNTKIMNVNNAYTGTGIQLNVSNDGYIYHNIIDSIEFQMLACGIEFSGDSIHGMNANQFTKCSYWSCTRCAVISGGGNTFTGIGQNAPYRSSDDESGCFLITGSLNTVDVFIYDVGNEGLIKYMYELGAKAQRNTLKLIHGWENILNDKLNYFIGSNEHEQGRVSVFASPQKTLINDFAHSGYSKFDFNSINMLGDFNNVLNSELITNIECTTTGDVTNQGFVITDLQKLRSLSKTTPDRYGIKLFPNVAGVYTLQLKYHFDLSKVEDRGLIRNFALKSHETYSACSTNFSEISVKQILYNGDEIEMIDKTPMTANPQHSVYRIFETPFEYLKNGVPTYTKSIKTLVIDIRVNATGSNNPSILNIVKLYASFYGMREGDSFNGLVNKYGDDIYGDFNFSKGFAPVITSPSGYKYRLKISDDGVISTEKIT